MKRTEMREMVVIYCDVCGQECEGPVKIFDSGTEHETHACLRWDPATKSGCAEKLLEQQLVEASLKASAAPNN